jgi:hypothetical protein
VAAKSDTGSFLDDVSAPFWEDLRRDERDDLGNECPNGAIGASGADFSQRMDFSESKMAEQAVKHVSGQPVDQYSRPVVRLVLDRQSALSVRNSCSAERRPGHGADGETPVLLEPGVCLVMIAHEK